jgi:ferric-dicitrate binding protein FerR (iron transport regulator)
MSYIENIITKIISGNASENERIEFNIWLEESEANKSIFHEKQTLWNVLDKTELKLDVNTNKAWDKFNTLKNTQTIKKERTFILYKVAAVFIILLSSTLLLFLFADKEQNKHLAVNKNTKTTELKLSEEKQKTLISKQSSNEISPKHFKRKDSVFTQEIVLPYSSYASLTKDNTINAIDFNKSETRITSLSGVGMFDIKPKDKDFVLETDKLKIIIQGTKFNIQALDDNENLIEIYVEEGFMEVFEKDNLKNNVKISSNEKYIFNSIEKTFTKINSPKKKRFFNRIFSKRDYKINE